MSVRYFSLYYEINIICILVLLYVGSKIGVFFQRSVEKRIFYLALISSVVMFVVDCFWITVNNGGTAISVSAAFVSKSIHNILTCWCSYLVFLWFEFYQKTAFSKTRKAIIYSSVFIWIIVFASVTNVFTGYIFLYDEAGTYHRGELFALQHIFASIYIGVGAVRAYFNYKNEDNYYIRADLLSFAYFPIIIFAADVVQLFVHGQPIVCVGITLSTIILYLDKAGRMVTTDPLTDISNRKQLMKDMNYKIRNIENGYELYALMMDLNAFKKINDNYGHVEGDHALIRMAGALKYTFSNEKRRPTISRYGGDEFIVLIESRTREHVDELCFKLHEKINAINETDNKPYNLSVSIGVSKFDSKNDTSATWMKRADDDLYEKKKIYHSKH
ncbi:MAG: GGDEF domain-containing protein [Butyrivibrio sp.]|nr:GGDEF domain-containing protein [Butyrivibrio sp.]